jgi:dienelactone hydrolase
VIVLILCAGSDAGAAEDKTPVQNLGDGRSGVIYFESLTPSGYFQLARKETTRKSVIVGTLSLPAGTTERGPAMVISHGSGGVSEAHELWWADQLVRVGIAAFVVDSFGPRNIGQTATDQSQLSTAANVADALTALKLLATHPRIDPARIGVLGFSKGGQVALYTELEPFRQAVMADDTRFALHVASYPYCSDWYMSERITKAPMLLLLGGQDNYTPAAPCRDYAKWFESKGADATVIVYRNAYMTSIRAVLPRMSGTSSPARTATARSISTASSSRYGPRERTSRNRRVPISAIASRAARPSAATAKPGSARRKTSKRSSSACYSRADSAAVGCIQQGRRVTC